MQVDLSSYGNYINYKQFEIMKKDEKKKFEIIKEEQKCKNS